MLGFKRFFNARRVVAGVELVQKIVKGQFDVPAGRKCCLPASPLLIAISSNRAKAWCEMLRCTGHSGEEPEERLIASSKFPPSIPVRI
jgi:hypothetical protein